MYNLLLLDVDGTLVQSKEGALPSPRVIEAVRAASAKIDVAIVTGRPYIFTKTVIGALGLTGYGVFNGGAEIIDIATGEQIFRQTMSVEKVREAITIALPYGYPIFNTIGDDEIAIKSPEDVTEVSDKLLIENVPTAEALNIVAALEAVEGTVTHPVSAWSDEDVVNITVAHEHASKRYGAERIMNMLGRSKEETAAIGDGHNDVPLLQAVGLGIAMGDAPNEVKELADAVTTSLAEDGVADAIEKFILK
ncbi:MAG: cof-like hydrolase [Candidatus Saccharibacteria bacterium]|nr:cof-like hydrolase [Candidatus Saccharibacteria bacterium]